MQTLTKCYLFVSKVRRYVIYIKIANLRIVSINMSFIIFADYILAANGIV